MSMTIRELERHIQLPSHLAEYDCGINEDIIALIADWRWLTHLARDIADGHPPYSWVQARAAYLLANLKCKE